MAGFPHFTQLDAMDCGPTSLRMIAKYYGKNFSLQTLRDKCFITNEGVSLLGISDAAESIGLRTIGVRISYDQLSKEVPLPCVAHWGQNHFVVVYKIKNGKVFVADPGIGLVKYEVKEFLKHWVSTRQEGVDLGICLIMEPTPDFYTQDDEKLNKTKFKFLFSYLKPYRKYIIQLMLGLLLGSLVQMIFPFLTQTIVDFGINNQNLPFVYLVLLAQLVLFISRAFVDMIRNWIILHISTRININMISDFLVKLMRLPIGFFDIKLIGDLLQRINDHDRIEKFLTSSTLNILFSFINLIIFGAILVLYDIQIFTVFFVASVLYIGWISAFMKKRRELDHKRFFQHSANQSSLIQLITGMQEIKMNNCEKQKRWDWENIQVKLFKVSIKSMTIDQYQQIGSAFINELKNIIISFLSAKAVIEGHMTLGMMMAVQYIIGQMNGPLLQMMNFFHTTQDARISLERLGEIHDREDEERTEAPKITSFPEDTTIRIKDVCFRYDGPHAPMILNELNLVIPPNKITAIVGASGSGKTTLLKLLLGFYEQEKGEINVGNIGLSNFSQKMWRQNCGVVLQEGYIFSDTIAKNVAISDEIIDNEKLLNAVKTACIHEFIESLPLRYNTKIGQDGHGLSVGQKQRLLIARAVYKNPGYLFLDEATSALDANNEKQIMINLEEFFKGRTVVVVAHRLSTVKNADQIVVLDKGTVSELGTHEELTRMRGFYYNLVKNQLELGN